MTEHNHAYGRRSLSAIQQEADDYAVTVLKYYKSDSPDLPALPDAEAVCYDTLLTWLDLRYDMAPEVRSEIAGAALGHAREEYGTFWGDDTLLTLNEESNG